MVPFKMAMIDTTSLYSQSVKLKSSYLRKSTKNVNSREIKMCFTNKNKTNCHCKAPDDNLNAVTRWCTGN